MQTIEWNALRQIYEEGIAGGNATFQQKVPDWEKWGNSDLPQKRN